MDLPKLQLKYFQEMWWWIFLSVLISSVIVHGIVVLASFFSLRKHKQGRWYFVSVAIMGIIMPLTGGIITSAVIAGIYQALSWVMPVETALVWGAGQTVAVTFLSFSRLLQTL
ncbi:transmembrane protein 170B-like [Clavelina lepadiformis]|uniref:transmembrane protein 170B-like n=1 Tax=Clavelina lepadiformis TaxID=159417 RepID=UPI004041F5B1